MFSKTSAFAVAGALFAAGFASAQDTQSAAGSNNVPKFQYGTPNPNAPGVVGANKNGPTNPKAPSMNTPINQTSDARLASINSIDDWCTFGPPTQTTIGDIEGETVAYCTKPRNNARVIPDGTVTAVHFIKTPLYVQVMANGDFTKINVVQGDQGGELDPHGATNMGNPVGGNVTSNVSGKDVFYEEWMNYISYSQMCFRVCIAGTDEAPTSAVCQHTLDEMGCNWVMPGSYTDNVFETCDADVAYPPGLYPQGNGQTSTFQQYFSSVYTDKSNGNMYTFVNGSPDQTTPTAAYSIPSSSQCSTTQTIANGIASIAPSSSSSSAASMATSASGKASSSASGAKNSASNAAASSSSGSNTSGASNLVPGAAAAGVVSVFGGLIAVIALL
ncbi:unnamed protein product [Sympodiomycopsis kandeliae]